MGVEPTEDTINAPNGFEIDRTELIERFIAPRRNSLSPRVFDNYRLYLRLANEVVGLNVFSQAIQ